MSKIAIVFAFNYSACKEAYYEFPAAIVDLYLAYKWAKSISCSQILIITDNTEKPVTKSVLDLIVAGHIDSGIHSFISTIKQTNEIHYFSDLTNYSSLVRSTCNGASRLFLYYSGHGESGNLVFPNYTNRAGYVNNAGVTQIHPNEIMRPAIEGMAKTGELFILFDTCESRGANLPYEWKKDRFSYSTSSLYPIYEGREIMVLSSSTVSAYTSRDGSHFTIAFFSILKENKCLSVSKLMDKLNERLKTLHVIKPSLHVSYPTMSHLPFWLTTKGAFSIRYTTTGNYFVINRG